MGLEGLRNFGRVFSSAFETQTTTTKTSRTNQSASDIALSKQSTDTTKAPLQLRMAATAGQVIGFLLSPFKFNPQQAKEDIAKNYEKLGVPTETNFSHITDHKDIKLLKALTKELMEYQKMAPTGFARDSSLMKESMQKIASGDHKEGFQGLAKIHSTIRQVREKIMNKSLGTMFGGKPSGPSKASSSKSAAKAETKPASGKERLANFEKQYPELKGRAIYNLDKLMAPENRALFKDMQDVSKKSGVSELFTYLELEDQLRQCKNEPAKQKELFSRMVELKDHINVDNFDGMLSKVGSSIESGNWDEAIKNLQAIRQEITLGVDSGWGDIVRKYENYKG